MRILGRLKNFSNLLKAIFAILLYRYPAKGLFVIGVTGTDGKTTTSHIIYEILKKAGYRVGLISTIGAFINDKELDTGLHTTMPEPFQMQTILQDMLDRGITHVVLEVTSHGMDQHRALGCNFRVGVLTNITHEHTDYHRSFENYRRVKARLFRGVKIAILNKDDANYDYIREDRRQKTEDRSYSVKGKADYWGDKVEMTARGMKFQLHERSFAVPLFTKLIGEYNVSNVLAAVGAARSIGLEWKAVEKAVDEFSGVVGRMEPINEGQDFSVIVDFAHTPAALENALTTLRKFTKGKLIAVFGSAGERDKGKRWLMSKISGKLADYTVLTAEDPRSEDIYQILAQMEKGAKKGGGKYIKITERGEAIAYAIQKLARAGDTVAVCGKGHERSMAYDGIEHPWSDQEAARNALRAPLAPVVVMAAGQGKRLNTDRPKVLYEIAGRPMISYTLENLRKVPFGPIAVVVGFMAEGLVEEVGPGVEYAYQKKPLGTGHAAKKGVEALGLVGGQVLVMNGDDSAFYNPKTLKNFLENHKKSGAVMDFMTVHLENPGNLGVVKKDKKDRVLSIADHTGEKKPGEVNAGTYVFDVGWFRQNIEKVKLNRKGEYYIIDLVDIAVSQQERVETFRVEKNEWYGVNTRGELEVADREMRKRLVR